MLNYEVRLFFDIIITTETQECGPASPTYNQF